MEVIILGILTALVLKEKPCKEEYIISFDGRTYITRNIEITAFGNCVNFESNGKQIEICGSYKIEKRCGDANNF